MCPEILQIAFRRSENKDGAAYFFLMEVGLVEKDFTKRK